MGGAAVTVTTATVGGQRHLGCRAKQTQTQGWRSYWGLPAGRSLQPLDGLALGGARRGRAVGAPEARPGQRSCCLSRVRPGRGGRQLRGSFPWGASFLEVPEDPPRAGHPEPLNPRGQGRGDLVQRGPRTADFLTPTRGLGTGLEDFVSIISAAEAPIALDFWACRAN